MRKKRTSRVVVGLLVPLVVVAGGWLWYSTQGHPLVTPGTASETANASPQSSGTGIRVISSPGVVADDLTLNAGQCRAVVIDAAAGEYLPDPACTPGAIDPAVTQDNLAETICKSGYTDTVRPPSSNTNKVKITELAAYGVAYDKTIELDHQIPLELGGANSVSNLWPEPNTDKATSVNNPKDQVENALNQAVCDRTVTLTAAQQAINTNWVTAEKALGLIDNH